MESDLLQSLTHTHVHTHTHMLIFVTFFFNKLIYFSSFYSALYFYSYTSTLNQSTLFIICTTSAAFFQHHLDFIVVHLHLCNDDKAKRYSVFIFPFLILISIDFPSLEQFCFSSKSGIILTFAKRAKNPEMLIHMFGTIQQQLKIKSSPLTGFSDIM